MITVEIDGLILCPVFLRTGLVLQVLAFDRSPVRAPIPDSQPTTSPLGLS